MHYSGFILSMSLFSSMVLGQTHDEKSHCNKYCNTEKDCYGLIVSKIYDNWMRPPVKNINELSATLKIDLDNRGALKNFVIEATSGNEKFDNSILLALKRSEHFCEIQGLSAADYEAHFKTVTLRFSPGEPL